MQLSLVISLEIFQNEWSDQVIAKRGLLLNMRYNGMMLGPYHHLRNISFVQLTHHSEEFANCLPHFFCQTQFLKAPLDLTFSLQKAGGLNLFGYECIKLIALCCINNRPTHNDFHLGLELPFSRLWNTPNHFFFHGIFLSSCQSLPTWHGWNKGDFQKIIWLSLRQRLDHWCLK